MPPQSAFVSISLIIPNQNLNKAQMTDINLLLRENIRKLVPYSSARHEFSGEASIFLDANENSIGSPAGNKFNRYPDPMQHRIKEQISRIKGVPAKNIFIGHGSDECIDLLFRAFCNPGRDNVIVLPPTYGMYEVSAGINDVQLREVPLGTDFQPDLDAIEEAIDPQTKIIWLCSPNNPTGNAMQHDIVEVILNNFEGLVVIDEAYVNFSRHQSYIRELTEYPNLVVMQTLSKAWGMAALRLGMAFAGEPVIDVLNRVKPPYNISQASQDIVSAALEQTEKVNEMTRRTVALREELRPALKAMPGVQHVYQSDANFLLVKMDRPKEMYSALVAAGIVVRDRSSSPLTAGCLRITVGTEAENAALLEVMAKGV